MTPAGLLKLKSRLPVPQWLFIVSHISPARYLGQPVRSGAQGRPCSKVVLSISGCPSAPRAWRPVLLMMIAWG